MGRPALPIKLNVLQQIILDEEKNPSSNTLPLTSFLTHCATLYNAKENPAKPINGANLYSRFIKGDLKCNVSKGSKNNKKLSPEHLDKLQKGRTGTRKSKKITDEKVINALRKSLPSFPKVIDGVIAGSSVAERKAKCLDCVNAEVQPGYRLLIRECTSLDCGHWWRRPFQRASMDACENSEKAESQPTDTP